MLGQILESALSKIREASTSRQLQDIKVEFLGKSSIVNQEMSKLSKATPEERKELGQKINAIKQQIQFMIDQQAEIIEQAELAARFESEKLDLTIPARPRRRGSIHPITQCMEELIQVFSKYGFDIKDGPSIEDDWYNFTALNISEDHPARQMHDTFYLKKTGDTTKLLRTHTSPIQIRTMQNEKPPYRFIAPGRTYRSDSDMTHTPMFHQIEGMVIDKNIHMGHLKYVIIDFIRSFFEQADIEVQFRPSFFPFTEPSAEVDIRMNKGDKWLEVLGCGMVHPNVLQNVGINPEEYQGFAFGLGVERFAMLKYGIRDLRQFFEGDLRWLNHYSFKALDIPTLAGGLTR
ncbi:MAG: phenylalanine--tRNA ligase subunit alpha [Rickettsiaceae bacterium]